MSTDQSEHKEAVRAIYSTIQHVSEYGSKPDALKYCYALMDAAAEFVHKTRGREAAYNFVQNLADSIITPGLKQ